MVLRHNWQKEELQALFDLPLMELVAKAHKVHAEYNNVSEIQMCSLISVKTGGCSENCKYCPQSARYQTPIKAQAMLETEEVLRRAKEAISEGVSRICLGAAWREVKDNVYFERIVHIVKEITSLGVEVCCTLGMLTEQQAKRLKEAGLYAYNHNLDSSERFYRTIISSRTYQDRLNTLDALEKTQLSVCSGGILGMGETQEDRLEMLLTLCTRTPHPGSVPLNRLIPIPGTPLADKEQISLWEMLPTISVARIIMPKTMIRLSAGRKGLSYEQQALCFFAGVNSIHVGEKLLTTSNNPLEEDLHMFQLLGLTKKKAFSMAENL